jgi:hypothetical protein
MHKVSPSSHMQVPSMVGSPLAGTPGHPPLINLAPSEVHFSWERPLHATPTTTTSKEGGFLRDLFSVSWRSQEGEDKRERAVLDMSGAMQSMRAHVNQDLRESLRARATGIKSLQVLEDTNVFLVFLKSPLNDEDKAIVKVRLLPSPDWPFSPAYIEAAVQLALQTLTPFCPHFAQMSFSLRGGGVVLPGWPLNKVVPSAQWSLNAMEVEVDGGEGPGGQSDLGDDMPILFVVEEFLDASVDSWFQEASDCVNMHSRHPNLPAALTNAACCLFQVVFALFSAQRWFSFQHNDLHHENIRLKQEPGTSGGAACETWTYSIPLTPGPRSNGSSSVSTPPLYFNLPGHVVRGRRVKIFDFGLSTLRGVHSLDLADLPIHVASYQPAAAPPSYVDYSRQEARPAAAEAPARAHSASETEEGGDPDDPSPDMVVEDGGQLFPHATEHIRWFAKKNIHVPPSITARAKMAIRSQALLPLPLACDTDDAARIPNLPMGREVSGYDLAVWVRHMLCHARGFCGLVAAVQAVAEREGQEGGQKDPQRMWAREFVEWVCQAAGLERTALRFIDGTWRSKEGGAEGGTVRGPRFYVAPSTPLVHFLRPGAEEQARAPLSCAGAMQSLLEHAFLRRWLDPPSPQTCVYRDPDPNNHFTAKLTSIHAPTIEERQEIQNRLNRTRLTRDRSRSF